MPKVKVNGTEIEAAPGERVIEAAKRAGVEIPHFCYHPALTAPANCRMCLVEQKGQRRLVPSCSTPVAEGMEINTESDEARLNRKAVMEFLLINHPLDCPTCDEAGECRLQDYTTGFGVPHSRYTERKVTKTLTDLSPQVQFWGNRCIACTRCIRFTNEVSGTGELGLFQRGSHNEIGTFPGKALDNPISMNVIDICPVGALLEKGYLHRTRWWFLSKTPTVCGTCAKGCNTFVDTYREEVMRIRPRENPEVNGHWICDEGRLDFAYTHRKDRFKRPMLRRGGEWAETGWDEALEETARGLRGVIERHGPQAVAGWGSARATDEEAFLLQALVEGLGGKVRGYFARPDGKGATLPGFVIPADRNPNRKGAERHLSGSAEAGIAKARAAGVKAVIALGGIQDLALPAEERAFLEALELLVAVETLPSDLARLAHIVLPGATPFERSGTFTNIQGKRQALRPALPPPGEAREDWQVLFSLAEAMGLGWTWRELGDLGEPAPAGSSPAGAAR